MSTKESVDFQFGGLLMERSDGEKILGVKTAYKLNFDNMWNINKMRVLARATPYMSVWKRKCWWTLFSTHSLTPAHLYGCYTAAGITIS